MWPSLDPAGEWQPLTRDAFRQLRGGDRIADRGGRMWTVHAEHQVGGLDHVVIRSGDLVRRVNERWADDFRVVAGDEAR